MEKFLLNHAGKKEISFHMPGHKGSRLYKEYGHSEFLEKIMDCDITEIPGADNLYQAEGIIKDVQKKYAHLYEVDFSYMLINSTSAGLIAAVMATVPKGEQLIMARHCHKAVFNGLNLAGVHPIYVGAQLIPEYGIAGAVSASEIEKAIEENPNARAVILPSPNYYGICSDIKAIAEVCHKNGIPLIVDQAHGAHLQFFHKYGQGAGMPLPAEKCGADIVVNSIHKTLGSFTQSAILNFKSNLADRYILEDKLQAVQSTSPSYLLMASLDINANIIERHGEELFSQWKKNIDEFYKKAKDIKGIKILDVLDMDRTKINIDAGIHGSLLEKYLMDENIIPELTTGNILMAMSGIGNRKEDYEKLFMALSNEKLQKIIEETGSKTELKTGYVSVGKLHQIPEKKTFINLDDSEGMIAAASLIPYPPGIPLICPGEEITKEAIEYIKELRRNKEKVVGIDDRGKIQVGKE